MKQEIVEKIIKERAKSESTKRLYEILYKDMEQYESTSGEFFDEHPRDAVIHFINHKKFSDIVAINTKLLYIKYYMHEIGCTNEVDDITSKDFDLCTGMREQLVPTLDDLYQRFLLAYSPDDGDSIFPLGSFAWLGMSFQEAISILKEDVDLNGRIIRDSKTDKEYRIPKRMQEILHRYSEVDLVRRDNRKIEVPDNRPEFIYKTVPIGSSRSGKPITMSVSTYWFATVRDKYNDTHTDHITMSYNDVVRSGRYAKARELELQGIDWEDTSNSELMQNVFQTKRIEPTYLRHNYFMYKKAFGLK